MTENIIENMENFFEENYLAFNNDSKKGLFAAGVYVNVVLETLERKLSGQEMFRRGIESKIFNEKFEYALIVKLMNICEEKLFMCNLDSRKLGDLSFEVKHYIAESGFCAAKSELRLSDREEAKFYFLWGMIHTPDNIKE